MIKYSFLFFIILLFTACSNKSSIYNYSRNSQILTLGKGVENRVSINLTNPLIQYQSNICVNESYILLDNNQNLGRLFIESISLNSNCDWNGLPLSFFESSIKSNLKINSLETVESFDISSYHFKTYKVNNDSYLSVIYIYGSKARFIIDYNGRLYDKLLKSFKANFTNRYYSKKRYQGSYNYSLVKQNFINQYFQRNIIKIVPHIGISISL